MLMRASGSRCEGLDLHRCTLVGFCAAATTDLLILRAGRRTAAGVCRGEAFKLDLNATDEGATAEDIMAEAQTNSKAHNDSAQSRLLV